MTWDNEIGSSLIKPSDFSGTPFYFIRMKYTCMRCIFSALLMDFGCHCEDIVILCNIPQMCSITQDRHFRNLLKAKHFSINSMCEGSCMVKPQKITMLGKTKKKKKEKRKEKEEPLKRISSGCTGIDHPIWQPILQLVSHVTVLHTYTALEERQIHISPSLLT